MKKNKIYLNHKSKAKEKKDLRREAKRGPKKVQERVVLNQRRISQFMLLMETVQWQTAIAREAVKIASIMKIIHQEREEQVLKAIKTEIQCIKIDARVLFTKTKTTRIM